MQTETLTQIKQQIVLLDEDAKQDLAEFLAEELRNENKSAPENLSDNERQNQIEWLKQNREKYAGKYVALAGNQLVGEGESLREANEQAKKKGFQNSFLTFVYSENDVPFGGW
ncbi:hypothetical protein BH10ACI1_BH10ACI1_14230 [soil metagenome]